MFIDCLLCARNSVRNTAQNAFLVSCWSFLLSPQITMVPLFNICWALVVLGTVVVIYTMSPNIVIILQGRSWCSHFITGRIESERLVIFRVSGGTWNPRSLVWLTLNSCTTALFPNQGRKFSWTDSKVLSMPDLTPLTALWSSSSSVQPGTTFRLPSPPGFWQLLFPPETSLFSLLCLLPMVVQLPS